MIGAFLKATGQLGDPAARRVIWIGLAAAAVIFFLLWTGVGYLLASTDLLRTGWLETVVDVLGGVATLVLTWLLFPAVISAVMSLFLEDIAAAVEARHYPALPAAAGTPLAESLIGAARFLAVMIVLNIALLFFVFVPLVFPFVFYGVNGYLLSREYFELVALRRMGHEDALALRKAHRGRLFLTGAVIAFLLTVPVVNLVAPVIATAAMVHLFESWRNKTPATPS